MKLHQSPLLWGCWYQCLLSWYACCCCRFHKHGTGFHKDIFIQVYNALWMYPFPLLLLPPLPISTFYSLLSLPGHLHIHDFMYLIKIQDPQKKREVIQYGSFWDLVSLKNLSASHICKMNFSHFLPPFPSYLSLCLLYDNLQLHPLSWKWHDFVLHGWIKSHGVYGPHFLFIHSPGSVQQLNCGGFFLKKYWCANGVLLSCKKQWQMQTNGWN